MENVGVNKQKSRYLHEHKHLQILNSVLRQNYEDAAGSCLYYHNQAIIQGQQRPGGSNHLPDSCPRQPQRLPGAAANISWVCWFCWFCWVCWVCWVCWPNSADRSNPVVPPEQTN